MATLLRLPAIPDSYTPVAETADAAVAHWKAIELGRSRWTAVWRRRLAAIVADEWRSRILPALHQGASSMGHAIVLVEMAVHSDDDEWRAALFRLYAEVAGDFAARTARGLKTWVAETKGQAEADAVGAYGLEHRWIEVVGRYLALESGKKIRQIQGATLALVRHELRRGVDAGESIPTIAARLAKVVPGMAARRATTIARTEIISASNLGARAGALDTGLKLDHEWIATPGPRTRPWHANANGQRRPIDDPFVVMGQTLMFPGDGSMGASGANLVNCRCTVGYRPASQ